MGSEVLMLITGGGYQRTYAPANGVFAEVCIIYRARSICVEQDVTTCFLHPRTVHQDHGLLRDHSGNGTRWAVKRSESE